MNLGMQMKNLKVHCTPFGKQRVYFSLKGHLFKFNFLNRSIKFLLLLDPTAFNYFIAHHVIIPFVTVEITVKTMLSTWGSRIRRLWGRRQGWPNVKVNRCQDDTVSESAVVMRMQVSGSNNANLFPVWENLLE